MLRCTYTTAANPVGGALNGTLAYVACAGANTLQIVDVSGPTATLRGPAPLDATAQSVAVTSALGLAANKAAANDLQVFSQPTRSVVLYPDGTVASPGAADFIQNQTANAQAGGFNVSGAGTVGGNLTVGSTTSLGAGRAPAQGGTPTTGSHNMLAVAYGQAGGSSASLGGTSVNYTLARTGAGTYTTFTSASGLSNTNFNTYAIVMSTYGSAPGFVTWTSTTANDVINVSTFNSSGTAADGICNFVVFQP